MNFKSKFYLIALIAIFLSFPLIAQEKTYVVGKGETIFSIARSFNVDRNDLMKLNGITDPTRLQAGQKLKIPGDTTASSITILQDNLQDVLYSAVRGDTFYGIARKFNTTVSEILSANSLSSNYVLKQGDVLRIPGNKQAVAAVTPVQVTPPVSAAPPPAAPAAPASQPPAAAPAITAAPAVIPVQKTDNLSTIIPDPSVRWPVTANELNYVSGRNSGVIVTGLKSEPVKSLTGGTVISAGPYRGYGRVAIIQAPNGYIYVYGGCDTLTVKEGDKVGPGMEMGKLGIDPITEKPQLFFRVYLNNTPVDPATAPRA